MKDLAAVYYDNLPNVDIKFNYIGELNKTSTYGVTCMHGDYGNAALQYILCENSDIRRIGTYSRFAECLHTDAIAKWVTVARCSVSDEGSKLLQQNVVETRNKGIKTSLTFTLDGKQRCVFDSGHWVSSEDGCPGGGSVPEFNKSVQNELNGGNSTSTTSASTATATESV
ncbi:hypothetical protein GGI11_000685 [Coemansia sp. RSA 2049]|nr:hypothetical protein GGI11_000685 [Coemansia sp. RSA 2049]